MDSKPSLSLETTIEDSLPPYDRHAHDYPSDLPLVEASPVQPTTWFGRLSKRAKIVLVAVLLPLAALVASMIWYGVHRVEQAKEWKLDNPADLSAARQVVEPEIPTSLASTDGDLLLPFAFSSPSISNRTFNFVPSNTVNATVLTSSSQLLSFPATINSTSYFVKVFGNRSTNVVFTSSQSDSKNWSGRVDAFWKVSPGGNQDERMRWGVDQLLKTVGGVYGYKLNSSDGDGAVGVAMKTDGSDSFRNFGGYLAASRPDQWLDSSMLFNLTIFVPPSSYARRLNLSSTADGDFDFNLPNVTFDSVDVRIPLGYTGHNSAELSTQSLAIFSGQGINGSYSLTSGSLLSHGSIQPTLAFPFTSSSLYASNLSLITTSGYISANITSFSVPGSYSSTPGVNINATSLAPTTYDGASNIFFPITSFDGSFEVATNVGLPIVVNTISDGVSSMWGGGSKTNGRVEKILKGKLVQGLPGGKGMVRLNSNRGNVRLRMGLSNSAYF